MPKRSRATRTSYRSPYRPAAVRVLNRLGLMLDGVRPRRRLTEESLLEQARRRHGFSDFGEQSFRLPLRVLLDSVESEAHLTPVGRWITRKRLLGMLGNRLRAEKLFREHPEIGEIEIEPPIVITGMQRTGTTLLHRLLAADPDTRALLSWEAINPAPLTSGRAGGENLHGNQDPYGKENLRPQKDPRLRLARLSQKVLAYLAPDFFAIHPVEARAPEEDVLLLDYSFLSTVPEATLRVPSYARWLESQDLLPAYRYMKKLLQLLHWQRPGRRWVLKSPHHLEYLDTLFSVFPRAKIIQTHRDPSVTLASFCSMIAHGRGVFSDSVDPCEIGRDWSRKVRRLVRKAMETRERVGEDRFLDVYFHNLLRDPMREIERIYEFIDLPLMGETRRSLEAALRVNGRHRYGYHRYRLEDFGLSPAGVEARFAEYRRRFNIPAERL